MTKPVKTLPPGIILMYNGHFRVRAYRNKTWHHGGCFVELDDAIKAHAELNERLGPRTYRTAAPRDSHYKQLVDAPLNISMRNITFTKVGGYRVCLTRRGEVMYFGNFPKLADALKCRDEAEKAYITPHKRKPRGSKTWTVVDVL